MRQLAQQISILVFPLSDQTDYKVIYFRNFAFKYFVLVFRKMRIENLPQIAAVANSTDKDTTNTIDDINGDALAASLEGKHIF